MYFVRSLPMYPSSIFFGQALIKLSGLKIGNRLQSGTHKGRGGGGEGGRGEKKLKVFIVKCFTRFSSQSESLVQAACQAPRAPIDLFQRTAHVFGDELNDGVQLSLNVTADQPGLEIEQPHSVQTNIVQEMHVFAECFVTSMNDCVHDWVWSNGNTSLPSSRYSVTIPLPMTPKTMPCLG